MESRHIQLRDGRTLVYGDYGSPGGAPVIYCHGGSMSHLLPRAEIELAQQHGLRLIVPARPGISQSSFQPNRTLLDWPDDVEALADALGVDKFGIIGVSRGGAYAAACAYKIPHRLHKSAIVSGPAPFGALRPAKKPPTASELEAETGAFLKQVRENPAQAFASALAEIPAAERETLLDFFVTTTLEAFRNGVEGDVYDWLLCYTRPWGFVLEDIEAEVHVWHGNADTTIPIEAAYYLARHIPDCTLHVLPQIGHFVPMEHRAAIFSLMANSR